MEWRHNAYLTLQANYNRVVRPLIAEHKCHGDDVPLVIHNGKRVLDRIERLEFAHRDLMERMAKINKPALKFLENFKKILEKKRQKILRDRKRREREARKKQKNQWKAWIVTT